MKIQRRNSMQCSSLKTNVYPYCISIVLGALLALSFFVIKDFFFYHIRTPDRKVLSTSVHDTVCDPSFSHELQRFVSKENVPRASLLVYEVLFLLWLCDRGDKLIRSIIIGSSVGAIVTMASKQIITSKQLT